VYHNYILLSLEFRLSYEFETKQKLKGTAIG